MSDLLNLSSPDGVFLFNLFFSTLDMELCSRGWARQRRSCCSDVDLSTFATNDSPSLFRFVAMVCFNLLNLISFSKSFHI